MQFSHFDLKHATSLFRSKSMHKMMEMVYLRCVILTSSDVYLLSIDGTAITMLFVSTSLYLHIQLSGSLISIGHNHLIFLVILFSRSGALHTRESVCMGLSVSNRISHWICSHVHLNIIAQTHDDKISYLFLFITKIIIIINIDSQFLVLLVGWLMFFSIFFFYYAFYSIMLSIVCLHHGITALTITYSS